MTRRWLVPPVFAAVVSTAIIFAGTGQVRSQPDSGGGLRLDKEVAQTGAIVGVVLTNAGDPMPVRGALVRLTGPEGTSDRLAGTNNVGRFVFSSLHPDVYSISVTKPGFLPLFFGSTRPGRGPAAPIAVTEGQRVEIVAKMLPGASIMGVITGPDGRPAPMVPVVAVRPEDAEPSALVRATTNESGQYRLYGLAPGSYVVAALPSLGAGGPTTASEVLAMTDDQSEWIRSALTSPTIPGRPSAWPPAPDGRPIAVPTVYFPGTTDPSAAVLISVGIGEERSDVGLALRVVPTSRVSGELIDQSGMPALAASVSIFPRVIGERSLLRTLISSRVLTLPRVDVAAGVFSITRITPGDYMIVAHTGASGRGASAGSASEETTLWSVTEFSSSRWEQTDLVVRLYPGASVSGLFAFEGQPALVLEAQNQVLLSMSALDPLPGLPTSARAVLDSRGTFRFSDLPPGTYALQAEPVATSQRERWTLKTAMLNGRDLADSVLEVQPEQNIGNVAVTFAREAVITGRAVDESGRPVNQYAIVVFTADRSLWTAHSRRIRSARPATDGTFEFSGLPAGEYALAAVESLDDDDLTDPEFLYSLLRSAHRMVLSEGETKSRVLRIGG